MNRTAAAFISFELLVLLAFAVVSVSLDSAPSPPPEPWETYPDADIILTSDDKGYSKITFKAYGPYEVTEEHPSEWFEESFSPNTDLVLRDISQAGNSLKIVFDGANVKGLTLLRADTRPSMIAGMSMEFVMVSGSIRSLSMITVSDDMRDQLGTSYEVMSTPIRNASLDLRGGSIDQVNPTAIMLSVTNFNLKIGQGMSIDRLLTTGDNGKYSNVRVEMRGGHVGYMSNVASRIGSLSYDIRSGTIDYFCIGANTEHNTGMNLANMSTSMVTGDVEVNISSDANVANCIMGAGILNMPRVLCNGDTVSESYIHQIQINAPNTDVYNDSAFLADQRSYAYHFDNYRIGISPYYNPLLDKITTKPSIISAYGEKGIWKSKSYGELGVGDVLSLSTNFIVEADGMFTVSKGGTLYNADDFILKGNLYAYGQMINNSIIQCRMGSAIDGEIEGIGVLADYVRFDSAMPSLNVISQRSAIVLEQSKPNPVESMSAMFLENDCAIEVSIQGSQRIYCTEVMLSIEEREPPKDYEAMYRLDIKGIDMDLLWLCTVDVTVPTDSNVCTALCVFNEKNNKYELVATAEYEPELRFTAGSYNEFYIYTYMTERPEPPQPPIVINTDISDIDYYLIAAIIGVLAVTVYALVTMKRD